MPLDLVPGGGGRTTTLVGPSGTVVVAAAPGVPRAQRRKEPSQHRFIADHWPSLAAAAHAGYREHGAGAVVVLAANPSVRSWLDHLDRAFKAVRGRGEFQTQSIWYATQLHTLPGAGDAWFDGWEARQVEVYDPVSEAVVVLLDGSPAGYRAVGRPSPAAAHAASRATLN